MKRQVIKIDEDKCNGCGVCIPNCAEGALQMVEGKARLISDLFCDGLGACIGHCPQDAISFEEREAEAYDEVKTLKENIIDKGRATIIVHLKHLYDHNETAYFQEAIQYLKSKDIEIDPKEITGEKTMQHHHGGGCPGSKIMDFSKTEPQESQNLEGKRPSQLKQWPIQMHLISPNASYFKKSNLLLAADCVAFSLGDFHKDYLKDKTLAIACPKLDHNKEVYAEKLKMLIENAQINTITVMIMEVPCCGGLLQMAKDAIESANRKIPLKLIQVGLQGNILKEEWV